MSIHLSQGVLAYCCAVAAVLGAAFGSFLNCAAWRIARGESFWTGRSRCPACGHTLGAPDLVPVLSWLVLRGRCRHCAARIPVRYLLVELFFAAVTVACLLRCDLTMLCLRNWVFLGCLFLLTLTDLDAMIIPDGCHIVALLAWLAALPFVGMGRDTMGGGDIKLMAVVGLYLGPIGALFALVLACVIGLLFHALRRGEEARPFPFGPSIAVATAAMLLFGAPLVAWYRGLLG